MNLDKRKLPIYYVLLVVFIRMLYTTMNFDKYILT